MNQTFYLAMNFNWPGKPNGAGLDLARHLVSVLESETGDRCTSRWMFRAHHSKAGYGKIAAMADFTDIARADYLIAIPLTNTSRGTHVEIGFACGLDMPVYLIAPADRDPTAFDNLLLDAPSTWKHAVEKAIERFWGSMP